ncbi:hypothetical protein VPH35_074535 [Triticum aestivum]
MDSRGSSLSPSSPPHAAPLPAGHGAGRQQRLPPCRCQSRRRRRVHRQASFLVVEPLMQKIHGEICWVDADILAVVRLQGSSYKKRQAEEEGCKKESNCALL